jgi:hypothetical protein
MYGNGVPIFGMKITMVRHQMEAFGNQEEIIHSGCCAVVLGTAIRGAVVARIALGTIPISATTTSVFA